MWPRKSHVLAPTTEADSGPKCRKIFCNDVLGWSFKAPNHMVSDDTLLNDPDCKIPFNVNNDSSDKKLGVFISQNNKPIDFFSRRLIKMQRNYTITEK